MDFPLTHQEHKYIKEIEAKCSKERIVQFSRDELTKYSDVLRLMCEKGVLSDAEFDVIDAYMYCDGIDGFKDWLRLQEKKAKRKARHDWRIAIFGALFGYILGLIPTIIHWVV